MRSSARSSALMPMAHQGHATSETKSILMAVTSRGKKKLVS
jgi:hypothetical protein